MAGWIQLGTLALLLVIAYRPLGDYMAWALDSPRTLRIERLVYRLAGVQRTGEPTTRLTVSITSRTECG